MSSLICQMRVGDVADHLDLREIDRIDLGVLVETWITSAPPALHEEGRLLDHVVADVDDEVGGLDRAVDEVAGRQRRAAEELGVASRRSRPCRAGS